MLLKLTQCLRFIQGTHKVSKSANMSFHACTGNSGDFDFFFVLNIFSENENSNINRTLFSKFWIAYMLLFTKGTKVSYDFMVSNLSLYYTLS